MTASRRPLVVGVVSTSKEKLGKVSTSASRRERAAEGWA
jgi:hypothetical protein